MRVLLSVHAYCAAGKRVTVAQVFVYNVKWSEVPHLPQALERMLCGIPQI